MSRQFMYVVAMNSKKSYTLHHFNPSPLFYPKVRGGGGSDRAAAAVEACSSLPPPAMSFHPIQFKHARARMEFMLFGRDRNKIVCTDETDRAVLYDDGLQAIRMLLSLKKAKWLRTKDPFSTSERPSLFNGEDFFWRSIPPPPYVYAPGYGGDRASAITTRAAAVGGLGVWISTERFGTYHLDTESGAWSKAGEWVLPFRGPAEYVPEYNLWFGISASEEGCLLCASDLAAASATRRPVVREWEGFAAPEGREMESFLLHLGGAHFCVAKLYKTMRQVMYGRSCCDHETTVNMFLMFTGVEIQRCSGKTGRELRVVKHKSWSKAGEWPLPFRGLAEYDLWFGVSAREDGRLCASVCRLRNPAAGDTCYHSCCHYETTVDMLVMFTGVKIQRCGGELQVVKHKSFRYSMGASNIPQILC
ncbi:hypothetical protein ACQ4PT_057469 [Festuca glaucescens]